MRGTWATGFQCPHSTGTKGSSINLFLAPHFKEYLYQPPCTTSSINVDIVFYVSALSNKTKCTEALRRATERLGQRQAKKRM